MTSIPPACVGDLLRDRARLWGDRPFLKFEDRTLSFREVDVAVSFGASLLAEAGVGPGDRVGILFPNGLDFPIWWLACARIGVVAVPMNQNYEREDLAYILCHSGAALIVAPAIFQSKLQAARESSSGGWPSLMDRLGHEPDVLAVPSDFSGTSATAVADTDLLSIQYTSGTTGFPKGCMLSHDYWLTLGLRTAELIGLGTSDVDLTAQQFHYLDPQWNLMMCLTAGATLVILPRFSASTFWRSVRDEGATFFYCVGAMPAMLFNQPPDPQVERSHKVRLIYCSGIPPSYHAAYEKRWGAPWREAFGMTETGVDLAVESNETASVGTGTVGLPIAGKRAAIFSESAVELPAGESGELWVSGRPMMLGYWQDPDATADTMRGEWLRTGDLARRDAEGRYFIVGRIKDMIRRGGENISSAEVEQAIMQHPGVKLAAVCGRADELRGEEVEAFILPEDGIELHPRELLDSLAERIARFKRPRYITIVSDIPLTPSARAEKRKLRAEGNPFVLRSFDAARDEWCTSRS